MDVKNCLEQIDKMAFEVHNIVFNKIREGLDPAINKSHIFLLKAIKSKENCTVTDIANHMEVTLSAITSLVNKLYEMGLVTRLRSESDRRIVYVGLTDEGEKVLKKADENRNKFIRGCFADLSHEEVMGFFTTLEKITTKIIEGHKSGGESKIKKTYKNTLVEK